MARLPFAVLLLVAPGRILATDVPPVAPVDPDTHAPAAAPTHDFARWDF